MNISDLVLVTGAYGFIASHCILQLLEQGYRVRGTLRSQAEDEPRVRGMIAQFGGADDRLELAQADLLADEGWEQAMEGCRYVLHVASPVKAVAKNQTESLVRPAVDGTRRVLQAARAADVQRVVLTSSVAAMIEGHKDLHRPFDEKDWSALDGDLRPYAVSKTLAEQAAWEYVKSLGEKATLELAVINPVTVLGPVLDRRHTSSTELIIRMMRRQYPGCARLQWMLVDVRDVAAAHLLAMTHPAAAGERFGCVSESPWMTEIAHFLNQHFASRGYKVPERLMPDWLVRLVTLFDPEGREMTAGLGVNWQFSSRKLVGMLGWKPRSMEDTLIETAESLISFGLV